MNVVHITNTMFSFDFMISKEQVEVWENFGATVHVLTDCEGRLSMKEVGTNRQLYVHIPFNVASISDIRGTLRGLRTYSRSHEVDILICHTLVAATFGLFVLGPKVRLHRVFVRHGVPWYSGSIAKRLGTWLIDLYCCLKSTKIIDVSPGVRLAKPGGRFFNHKSRLSGLGSAIGVSVPESQNGGDPILAPFTLGYVSRLTSEKGITSLIQFANMMSSFGLRNRVILFGPKDGEESFSFPLNIEYRGVEYDKEKLYQDIDILLNFSKREGMSTVVLEAAARGIPCLGFDVIGIRDAIVHGKTGFVIKTLQEGIARLNDFESSLDLYALISAGARSHVEVNFSRHIQVQKFVEIVTEDKRTDRAE